MADHTVTSGSTTDGLPVAPTLGPTLQSAHVAQRPTLVDARVVLISVLAIGVALAAGVLARVLTDLIGLITNLSFYGRLSTDFVSPAHHALGAWVIVVPAIGGVIVGFMARYGSEGIRGHGIPEAMEQVLLNQSRVPPRLTFLKPLSAAIAIGTGGPVGAEGPIIATGGALGSLVGQLFKTTAMERKTLLAAGAAAGMTATFGSPVSAVLLAIELLLFEFRPRSLIPVALASAVATGVRFSFVGAAPMFPVASVSEPSGAALAGYIVLGALVGVASVYVTRAVYAIEDGFSKLPIHWMWWPALGGLVVGLVGLVAPHTLGVGYDNISDIVAGDVAGKALLLLCGFKLVSWSVALGSGTSGGTLAPLFTIGGGLGALLGAGGMLVCPWLGMDTRIAALVGMAAMFAGASRALLASVVFVLETTHQPLGLLPLLGGGTAAFFVSCLMLRNTIMTEKIVRRGVHVPAEYVADLFDQLVARDCASAPVVALQADDVLGTVRAWLASGVDGSHHQGFPVLDPSGDLVGVVTRRDLLHPAEPDTRRVRDIVKRAPVVAYEDSSLRTVADLMVDLDLGRLPVVSRSAPNRIVGMLTRGDLLSVHKRRLTEAREARRVIQLVRRSHRRPEQDIEGPTQGREMARASGGV
ncbi:MAG: chloride channel protein [Candidatus Binatia bacterium]